MKKILALAIALNLLNSCVTEAPIWERTYQIKNSSNYDITIRIYDDYIDDSVFVDENIPHNQILIGNIVRGSNFNALSDPESPNPLSSFYADRFIIIFNNEKQMIHSIHYDENDDPIFSEPTNRNLIRSGNYTHIGNDIYEYVLTEEDYNNATPCNGDCLD